jgi:ubiquinone/menaquinone biosynthesis C-methylase UbiE
MTNVSDICRAQCERTAREYFAFRMRGGSANELVEAPAMRKLIGNVQGKKVIDCGCGFGCHAIESALQGAHVTAIDISATMLDLAREEARKAGVTIDFLVQDMTEMKDIVDSSFDVAISSLAICFSMPEFFKEVHRILKPRGVFCFSEVHPIFAGDPQSYFDRGMRTIKNPFGKLDPANADYDWQWEHYTLGDFFGGLRNAGFQVDALWEPEPDPTKKPLNPELYERASQKPVFFLVRALKN